MQQLKQSNWAEVLPVPPKMVLLRCHQHSDHWIQNIYPCWETKSNWLSQHPVSFTTPWFDFREYLSRIRVTWYDGKCFALNQPAGYSNSNSHNQNNAKLWKFSDHTKGFYSNNTYYLDKAAINKTAKSYADFMQTIVQLITCVKITRRIILCSDCMTEYLLL